MSSVSPPVLLERPWLQRQAPRRPACTIFCISLSCLLHARLWRVLLNYLSTTGLRPALSIYPQLQTQIAQGPADQVAHRLARGGNVALLDGRHELFPGNGDGTQILGVS